MRTRLLGERDPGGHTSEPIAYGVLHQRMVERYAPPSLLVSPDDKVVHLSEHVGRYLVHPGGEPTLNVYKLVRSELRIELRETLHRVRKRGEAWQTKPLHVRFNGETHPVVLHVRPALEPQQHGFALVIFDEREAAPAAGPSGSDEDASDAGAPAESTASVQALEDELDLSRQRFQAIIEEYETSQEELKASNEELQSANEELRSTLEELETSKEELQSMNEELQTVNQENRHKVEELAQLSGDLQNLMAASQIATLFLDRELRIMRFTPRVGELFNVRPVDRGRPLADLTHRLGYDELRDDARRVLDHLVPVEREVRDEEGRWYLTRVLPYRSTQDRIEGVVITFVEITKRKEAEEDLRESEEQFRALVDASAQMVWTTDAEGHVVEDSPSWRAFTGQTLAQWKGAGWLDAVHPEDRDRTEARWRESVASHEPFATEFRVYHAAGRDYRWTTVRGIPLHDPDGSVSGWVGMNIDTHETKEAEEALRQSEERYRLLVESATEYAIIMLDTDGYIVSWNRGAERIFGYSEREIIGQPAALTFVAEDRAAGVPERELLTAAREGQAADDRWHVREDGDRFWANGVLTALRDDDGTLRGFAKVLRDNTERKRVEDELRWLNETLEARVRERTDQVRELASTLAMAEQDERRRIAQILHDDLQQLLFGIQLKMTFVRRDAEAADDTALAEHAAEADRFLDRAIQVTRHLTVDLSPPILAGEGLTQALEWLTTQMEDVHNLSVEVLSGQSFVVRQEGMRVLLFQIVRELLFNVVKHARTDRAIVTLDEEDDTLVITVEDEGRGFDPTTLEPDTEGGFGLFSVRERLRLFGGRLEIDSAPGEGTRMTAVIPAVLRPAEDG
jgi:two-component system CheB/CheR fusion protein